MDSRTSRRLRAAAASVAVALAASTSIGLVAAPALAATPDITEHGGAARNDGDMTDALRASIVDGPAKNVILLIGDGMGDSEITVARDYAEGAAGRFAGIDALPLTGQYTTYSIDEAGKPNYASESASTASAWATGTKTVNGRLSVDVANKPQATLLEIAKANGLKTGNVSTAEIQDATPGAQISHISARGCYGPDQTSKNCASEALENGGLGSISEQLLNVRPDVTLGGGAASFAQTAKAGPWQGKTLSAQAEDRGFTLVKDAAGLDAVTTADADRPLLGLFTEGNFPVRWNGPAATDLTAGGQLPAPVACAENPDRLATGLSLASLTSKAIDLLDGEDGFFLQVEGASIDKQDHAANACGQIGETVDLDEAVQVALEFARTQGDTLVVVTADHAHTSQIVGSAIPGLNTHLLTADGQPLIVAYGTSPAGGSQQHTGSQVRIAGYGPGAANVVGLTDQTDLFFTAANGLALSQNLAALSTAATLSVPAEVRPGAEFTVVANGFAADWQLTGEITGAGDLGQRDALRGSAGFAATAPTKEGAYEVTVRGSQTGTTKTASFTVSASAAPVPTTTPTPAPSASAGAGAIAGGGNGGAPLAMTGAALPIGAAVIAAGLLAAGAYLRARRQRRTDFV
ncbi:alkaline phosphatase [Microbacterium sp. VKM Ac-2923]|uniref:alkaline phosphatase n=1 Tax=Microbacterium sp. VKM Ac-2923 TaxID=2929476 RepID=UPI001FB3E7CB|nr:alkaline phosphatase [Microbacterium sp. VKM Ac-2923]MCJ1707409.1 alkaline phosphatase [Microbacterium sp. VKM Ac-2923]